MAKILIVEDDNIHIFLIKHALEKIGHEIFSLNNPLDFENTLIDVKPDLIIMDLNLPQRNGISIIYDMRQISGFASIPVVVVTASSLTGIQSQLAELGCQAFISKPFRPEKLVETVNAVLLTV